MTFYKQNCFKKAIKERKHRKEELIKSKIQRRKHNSVYTGKVIT